MVLLCVGEVIACRQVNRTPAIGSNRASRAEGVINPENYHRPNDRDDDAIEVHARNPRAAEGAEDHAADDRAHDAERHIEPKALASPIHDLLPIYPAIRPRMIQAMMDIRDSPILLFCNNAKGRALEIQGVNRS